jgi:hypothetical protein
LIFKIGIFRKNSFLKAKRIFAGKHGFLLQFYKTVVGHRLGKIRPEIILDMIDIEKFKVTTMTLMKQYHNGDYLAVGHRISPVTAFFRRIGRKTVSLRELIEILAEFVDYE